MTHAAIQDAPLTVAETAARLRCCRQTVYRLVKERELAAIRRPGCKVLIPQWAIQEYEDRHLCPANA